MFDGLEPNKNIVNVIIYCKKDDLNKLTQVFKAKSYPIQIKFVTQDNLEALTNAIDEYTQAA